MKSGRVRVALLVDTVGLNAGTERLVAETARRLDPTRMDVHVCCLEDSPQLQELARFCKVRVFPADRLNSLNGIRQIRSFRRYLREMEIDVIHSFMTRTSILGVSAGGSSVCKALVTARMAINWYTPKITALLRYYMNPRTTRILANSEAVKRFAVAKEKVSPARVDVIYQGVDVAQYSPDAGDPNDAASLGIPAGAKVVGIVANYRPVKDLPLFLRAAGIVARQAPDVVFLLVGAGQLHDELVRLSEELGISNRVFFSNGRGQVLNYLKRMCIGALCSESEGFSNAILEYMAMGLPVVATDVGGVAEAVVDRETGYLVRQRDPAAFAAPLVELLRNEELRFSMSRRALDRCHRLFTMEAYIRRLEAYYLDLAKAS